ncbi:MAG TPA: ABC transporter ATP-binding protein, partial [Aeromonadales bacterium]|nr:ABC transporter ATP-binding protein [Aeromonadales bacterium]
MSKSETIASATEKEATKLNSRKKLSTLLALVAFVKPYKKILIGAIIALIFTAGVSLSIGAGVRMLIDQGFSSQTMDGLANAVIFMIWIAVMMALGTFIRFYLVSSLGERVSADIRLAVFDHLLTLPPGYFETNRSGEIMSRLTTDTTLLQSIIGSSFSMALRSSLTFIGALIIMLVTNTKLTLIVLSGVPLILLPVLLFGKRVKKLSTKSQDSIASVGSYAGEIIQHMKTVQSYTREEEEKQAFDKEVENAYRIAKSRVIQRAVLIAAVILMVFSAITAVFWVGGGDVIKGNMSSGELGAFFFYTLMLGSAVATWSEVFSDLQRAAGA